MEQENKHEVLKPYPYQEEGIEKILLMKRLIEGDEMGLGKTAQAIVAVERAKATPALVICPASLKINWEREIKKFTNLRPLILTDSVKSTFPYFIGDMNLYDVVITNFESLRKFFVVDAPKPYKLSTMIFQNVVKQLKSVIIDESARVKEPSALSTKICAGICHGKEYVVGLTGTPIVNCPPNLATQLAVIGRINDFEGGYGGFLDRYGGTGKNDPPRNLDELRRKITDTMFFRRSKTLVLKDLPDLTRSTVETELDPVTQEEYDTCQQDLIKYLTEYKNLTDKEAKRKMRMAALIRFMNLRSISAKGKVSSAIDFLNDCQEPCIVFCEHHDVVDEIHNAFSNTSVCVTGRQNAQQKQYAIDSFQAGRKDIIICSIKAAGVGLTLTRATHELFVELPWTMADLSQAEARAWRQGQKNAVNSWVLIGCNTIDTYLFKLIMDKGKMANRITGASDDVIKDEVFFDELAEMFLGSK